MNHTTKYPNPEYRLAGIELSGIHLYHENKPERESKKYHFNINIEHKVNIEKKVVFAITSVNVFHEDQETLLGSAKVACNFEVKNLEKFTDNKNKTVDLPLEMRIALNSVSISTTRGVMYAKLSGTFLHKAHLPLINPEEFTEGKK